MGTQEERQGVREAIRKLCLEDRQKGEVRDRAQYRGLFPGFSDIVDEEYVRLLEESPSSVDGGTLSFGPPTPPPAAGPAPAPPSGDGPDGERVGPYRILKELGRGGMGVVYLAEDTRLPRKVALKVLPAHFSSSRHLVLRFQREAALASKLDHPHICTVYEAGESDGTAYMAMRFLEGKPLSEWVGLSRESRRPSGVVTLPPLEERPPEAKATTGGQRKDLDRILLLVEKAARALHVAHEKGLIHRDIKPHNIMVTEEGEPVLLDFGLAREEGEGQGLTQTGSLMGTPAYLSPEQLAAQRIKLDRRTDVYSLGVTLYECLTLRVPFEAPTLDGLYQKILMTEPEEPRRLNRAIPKDLQVVVETAIDRNRERRYQTALALAEDLRRVREHEPIVARPAGPLLRLWRWAQRKPAVAASVAVAFLALVAGLAASQSHLRDVRRERDEKVAALGEKDRALGQSERERKAKEEALGQKDQALTAAQAARDEEKRQRGIAEDRKRAGDRLVYAAGINQAQRAADRRQPHLALQLLDSLRPRTTGGGFDEHRGWEWDYLKRRCHSEKLLLTGHTGHVTSVAYGPNGALLASGSNDGTARLWDAETGRTTHVLKGHLHAVRCVAFSPDGAMLATGGQDADVRLWDTATGAELGTLGGHVLQVNGVAFSPKGELLATAGADGTVQIHDLAGRKRLRVLSGHGGEVECVAFSPDGAQLASAGSADRRRTVRLWDVASGDPLRAFEGNTSYLQFTPDGKRLMFGGMNDLSIVACDTGQSVLSISAPTQPGPTAALADFQQETTAGQAMTELVRPSRGFGHAALSADGRQICTADRGLIQVWDASTGREVRRLRTQGEVVAWSPDGRRIVVPGGDRRLRVWSLAEEPEGMTLRGHRNHLADLAFSPDGMRLASGSFDQSIKIWDSTTGEEVRNLGKHAYVYEGEPPRLTRIDTQQGHEQQVHRVAYSPDGRWLASAGGDKTLRAWDAASGAEVLTLRRFHSLVTSVAWTPDGTRIAAGSWDDDVRLFDFPSGRLVRKFEGHEENVTAIAFMDGGKLLASAGWDETVRIWDVGTGRQLRVLKGGHLQSLTSLAVGPDDRLLAVAGQDMVITVWDTSTWEEVRTLWGHTGRIDDLAFSPDGRRLVSVSGVREDGAVKLWDVVTGVELLSLPGAYSAAFSPDGRRLAVGSRPNDVRIYETVPFDGQAYRTAPFESPPADENRSSDDGKLRVLGFLTARRLPGVYGAPRVMVPSRPGGEFLMAVVSLPHRFFIPSPEAFDRIVEEERKQGEESSPHRECVALYNSKRFRLLLQGGGSQAGELVGPWPSFVEMPGFTRSIQMDSSSRIRPHDRVAWTVAWSVDPTAAAGPMKVQFDGEEPVPVPGVRLAANLEPSPSAVIGFRIERALAQVRTEEYSKAVEEAASAAGDKEADAVAVYNAACVHALAVARARQDATLPEAEREERAERYAGCAVDLLRLSVARGFDDLEHMRKDEDLDALHQRGDFEALLEQLEGRTRTGIR